jgi:hypothetical protein
MISLNEMSKLAKALLEADENVDKVTKQLKKASEAARVLREETIPNAMHELELEKLKLNTGQEISIKQEVYCSIPKANKEACFKWLIKNKFGGLIKVALGVKFGVKEMVKAKKLFLELQKAGLSPDFGQTIHASTLKAFLKDEMAKGTKLPMDLFGARPVWVAKIK